MNEALSSVPVCVGLIMDGNRRWARAQGKLAAEGHTEGYNKLEEVMRWAREADIPHVVVYGFSTENWERSENEINHLIKLLRFFLEKEMKRVVKNHVRVRFIGDRSRFSADIQTMMEAMESATATSYEVTLHLLLSYGGRAEIVSAVNALLKERTPNVSEDAFIQKLWSYPMPDPDLIIRTGGEKRLSNFLPWQSIYSELFFSDTLWPDFSKEEFNSILTEFASRERRRGK
jgi:undecaprenyl diphosphate synthase